MKNIFSVICVAILSACATVSENPIVVERIERPMIGEVASAAIGETMVIKYEAAGQLGFRVGDRISASFYSIGIKTKIEIEPQAFVLVERRDDGDKIYRGVGSYCAHQLLMGCQDISSPRIVVPKDASESVYLAQGLGKAQLNFRPPVEDTIVTVAAGSPSIKKELIFNGRSGSAAKFLYREYKDDFARSAFSQELQYDLSEGMEIGFQELRINIIETSNTGITYTVIKHFDWQGI